MNPTQIFESYNRASSPSNKSYKYCPSCSQPFPQRPTESNRLQCTNCNWTYYHNPSPGVVTLITDDGDEIECYVFDRQQASDGSQGSIRYMTKAALERTPIQIQHISEIRFSGKDTAAGKSFERWIAKYIEKKMAGETASIDCDSLDDQ